MHAPAKRFQFLLVVGFGYSYFWSASTIVYILMRRYVDDTEMDEVYLEDDEPDPDQGGVDVEIVGEPDSHAGQHPAGTAAAKGVAIWPLGLWIRRLSGGHVVSLPVPPTRGNPA